MWSHVKLAARQLRERSWGSTPVWVSCTGGSHQCSTKLFLWGVTIDVVLHKSGHSSCHILNRKASKSLTILPMGACVCTLVARETGEARDERIKKALGTGQLQLLKTAGFCRRETGIRAASGSRHTHFTVPSLFLLLVVSLLLLLTIVDKPSSSYCRWANYQFEFWMVHNCWSELNCQPSRHSRPMMQLAMDPWISRNCERHWRRGNFGLWRCQGETLDFW